MSNPVLLYSANTWLAYTISQDYYNGKHYVWCNRYPNSRWLPSGIDPLPPSSSPGDIYLALREDVRARDRHSAKIEQNKTGIRAGANAKFAQGLITTEQVAEINRMVGLADLRDFRPLLYIIPFESVALRVEVVEIDRRANLYHPEYLITDLARAEFEVIELLVFRHDRICRNHLACYAAYLCLKRSEIKLYVLP